MIEGFRNNLIGRKTLISTVIVATLFGFGAGLAGDMFSKTILLDAVLDDDLLTEVNGRFFELLSKYRLISENSSDQPLELVIRKPGSGTLENPQKIEVGGLLNSLRDNSVLLFSKKPINATEASTAAYWPSQALARAVILTSDGWLLTSADNLPAKQNLIAVTATGEILSVENIIIDPLTKAAFVKVAARNLAAASYDKTTSVNIGQALVMLTVDGGALTDFVSQANWLANKTSLEEIITTETLPTFYRPTGSLDQAMIGSPVLNMTGGLIGLVDVSADGQKIILPFKHLAFQIETIFRDQAIKRPSAGLTYFSLNNLAMAPSFDQSVGALRRGAYLYRVSGAGAKAGLKVGDVVLKVEGEEVNNQNSLSDLIQSYTPGSTLDLTIWRAGQEQVVVLTLE